MSAPIRIFIDGSCRDNGNNGQMGIGIVVEWKNNKLPTIISKYIGEGTNNIAEHTALLEALKLIEKEQIMNVRILSDSNLVVKQINNIWKCKDLELRKIFDKSIKLLESLKNKGYLISIEYIPRKINIADTPANNGSNINK